MGAILDKRILMLVPLTLLFLLSMFYRSSSAVIASELMIDFSLTPEDLGLLSSVFFYAFALVQIPMGAALDSFGARRAILFLSSVGLVGVVSFALADSFPLAIAGRGLMGVGMACCMMGTFKLISIWFPPRAFTTISGIILSIGTLGNIGATAPLAVAVDWIGWRNAFLVIALIHLLIIAWIYVQVVDFPKNSWAEHAFSGKKRGWVKGSMDGMVSVFRLPSFWLISLASFARYGVYISIAGLWAGPYLEHIYHVSLIERGKILMLIPMGYLIGSPIFGLLSDRVWKERRTLAAAAMFFYTLCIFPFIGAIPSFSIRMIAVTFFLLGFSSAFAHIMYANIKELLPGSVSGTAMSAVNFFTMSGAGFFQHVMGIVIERASLQKGPLPPEAFSLAFGLCFIAAALGAIGYLFVRKSHS
jgi:MFS family permease